MVTQVSTTRLDVEDYANSSKGYKLSNDMRAENIVEALHMKMRYVEDRANRMIHHADRGHIIVHTCIRKPCKNME